MNYNIVDQAYPIPENIENCIKAGYLADAKILIDNYLGKNIPSALRQRLLIEKEIMHRRASYYSFRYEEAERELEKSFKKYERGMLKHFLQDGLLEWAYINGELRIEGKLIANAAKRCDILRDGNTYDYDLKRRDAFISLIKDKKEVKADITVKETIKLNNNSKIGRNIHVNLPLSKEIPERISDVRILSHSESLTEIDSVNAAMRTAVFEKKAEKDDEFSITFSYTVKEELRSFPQDGGFIEEGLDEYLKEELPHIRFTPYLRKLEEEITKGKHTPKEKAEAIYYWITENVRYSFVRPYATINNIAEYAATSLKGDCGVQSILFITLSRIAGIPARWESGWYVTPEEIYNHDWAALNISGTWYPVDCSFGGGAFREGNRERQAHYFGNLDIFRMIANTSCSHPLTGKKAYSQDPTDNQKGEVEIDGVSLIDGYEIKREVISFLTEKSR